MEKEGLSRDRIVLIMKSENRMLKKVYGKIGF
jgi:hypothetical protein